MNKEILEEKVYYYTDVVEDPKKLVDAINNLQPEGWAEWLACSGGHYLYGENMDVLPASMRGLNNSPEYDYVYNTINTAMNSVAKNYAECMGNNDDPKLFPVYPIKKYMAGTYMGAHFDQQEGDGRLKYSLVMYLNDDYEGGEISFTIKSPDAPIFKDKPKEEFDQADVDSGKITFAVKPKAGSIIIFPPSPPYHHTAHLVKSGFKYMIPQHWIH
jgi:hypothetical protein